MTKHSKEEKMEAFGRFLDILDELRASTAFIGPLRFRRILYTTDLLMAIQ